jgi:hypothetical protein
LRGTQNAYIGDIYRIIEFGRRFDGFGPEIETQQNAMKLPVSLWMRDGEMSSAPAYRFRNKRSISKNAAGQI